MRDLETSNFRYINVTEVLVTLIHLLTDVSNFRFVHNVTRPVQYTPGARGDAVVEALRYKPEGREIDYRWCH
jgi:hypothetical protein